MTGRSTREMPSQSLSLRLLLASMGLTVEAPRHGQSLWGPVRRSDGRAPVRERRGDVRQTPPVRRSVRGPGAERHALASPSSGEASGAASARPFRGFARLNLPPGFAACQRGWRLVSHLDPANAVKMVFSFVAQAVLYCVLTSAPVRAAGSTQITHPASRITSRS